MSNLTHKFHFTTLTVIALLLLLQGCAGQKIAPIFYPPPPDQPRYQYLKSYSSEVDVKESVIAKTLAEGMFEFRKAFGVTSYKNTILATDNRLRGYAVIDLDQQKIHFVARDPGNQRRSSFSSAFGIAVDQQGRRYIADKKAHRVLIYSADDKYIRSIDFKQKDASPTAVAVGGGKLYVAHLRNSRIDIFDLRNDTLVDSIGTEHLRWPSGLDWRNNKLYVSDLLRYKVLQFNDKNEFEQEFGEIGDGTGKLSRPKGVAVDNEGRVLVVDSAFGNFQIFRKDKQLLGFVSQSGQAPENLSLPAHIHVSYSLAPFFQKYAAPGFQLEYVVLVANQSGPSKINIYGFGHKKK